jgi:hypothetical protein
LNGLYDAKLDHQPVLGREQRVMEGEPRFTDSQQLPDFPFAGYARSSTSVRRRSASKPTLTPLGKPRSRRTVRS